MNNHSLSGSHRNSVALVTGGGSGIGAALCRRLAAAGASVAVADVDTAGAEQVAAEIGGMPVGLDVVNPTAWGIALSTVIDTYGQLDMLALNAGIMTRPRGAPSDDDPIPLLAERYEAVRGVNIDGVFFGIMAGLAHLEAVGGNIVCTASSAGLKPLVSDPVYSMTKHAVIGLVRSLAAPLAKRGVSIAAVCPGGVDTPIVPPDIRSQGRVFATPDHIAEALESALNAPLAETGGIWISREDQPKWRYEFASPDAPPSIDAL